MMAEEQPQEEIPQDYDNNGTYDPQYNYDYYNNQEQQYNPNIIAWGTAIYTYQASSEGELSFNEGEVIGILEEHEDGWTMGELNGIQGLFPGSYIQKSEGYWDNGNYNYANAESGSSQQKEEATKKRREMREKLKGEMRGLKDELEKSNKTREQTEKDIRDLTELKQKLRKELHHLKAEMSDKNSVVFDLIKLTYGIDFYSDSRIDLQNPSQTVGDALNTFTLDLQKESKSSAALAPLSQKVASRLKDLRVQSETTDIYGEEADKLAKMFYAEVEGLKKVLERREKRITK